MVVVLVKLDAVDDKQSGRQLVMRWEVLKEQEKSTIRNQSPFGRVVKDLIFGCTRSRAKVYSL